MRGNHEFLQMAMIRTFKALEQALKGRTVNFDNEMIKGISQSEFEKAFAKQMMKDRVSDQMQKIWKLFKNLTVAIM